MTSPEMPEGHSAGDPGIEAVGLSEAVPEPAQWQDEEEQALLGALRAGQADAFELLIRRYGGRMLAVAQRFLRSDEEARDAVQEAFISAWKAIGRFEGHSRLSTWLHRIVVNASLMRLRSRKRDKEESIEELLPGFDEEGHQIRPSVEWAEESHAAVERKETCALVRSCIEQLPGTYRTILMMRDIEEMDTTETARALGITENAVKIRLHRARQALRTLLDPHFRGGQA